MSNIQLKATNEQELAVPKHALEIEGGRREGKVNAGMKLRQTMELLGAWRKKPSGLKHREDI